MRAQRDNTRRRLLAKLNQLELAREAFVVSTYEIRSGVDEDWRRRQSFLKGFDWVIGKIRKIA